MFIKVLITLHTSAAKGPMLNSLNYLQDMDVMPVVLIVSQRNIEG